VPSIRRVRDAYTQIGSPVQVASDRRARRDGLRATDRWLPRGAWQKAESEARGSARPIGNGAAADQSAHELGRAALQSTDTAGNRGQNGGVPNPPRLVTVVLEVSDLDRTLALYRDGFGLDLHQSDHRGGNNGTADRWISGRHAAITWTDGAFIHFALYESKGERTSGAQVSFSVENLTQAHDRAVAAGATVVHAPRNEPWGRSARYRDFDDNVVELTQPIGG
jgi:predicted enzyme related to lactoylglutathione lyase